MNLPTPSVEYGLLSPMLIVFGAAIAGVLVEAFVPRERRYAVQVVLSLVGLVAAFVAVVQVARGIHGAVGQMRSPALLPSTRPRCSCRARSFWSAFSASC